MPTTPNHAAPPRPPVIALMGPTASGKTAASLAMAQRFGGEIVSVDSALVYRRLDIGSAKPSPDERALVPHHMIDICDPHEVFSAAEFASAARRAIDAIHARGRLPILVGGTGLYFRALLDGLNSMPAADAGIRSALEQEAARRGWTALHGDLAAVDPDAARRIKPGDAQRISRALEVWRLTGTPISVLQQQVSASPGRAWRVLKLILCPADRNALHRRIAHRYEVMRAQGLVEEVAGLRTDPRLHADLPAMRAVGYRQVSGYLDGAYGADELAMRVVAATRQLAKRQITWLRREWDGFWRDPTDAGSDLAGLVGGFLGDGTR